MDFVIRALVPFVGSLIITFGLLVLTAYMTTGA